ncbi:PVC-type heme-binding CxxCH protein [Aureliella helgolandensis]|uniref:Neutral/alkaline non-lysosomal ceramidase n=1 Tax=Aureliella helgolandensis TaxID=2527968 RepID=A0A518G407_9BACT|nr:PVC-type heme-binding CxxCH protein [Aureliella helgolandensis]QDV23328.1 Neutral/alkaline non-lysosomal ceramidase [Aureliella helgolandensis]
MYIFWRSILLAAVSLFFLFPTVLYAELRVGAAAVDITPEKFPVLISGGILSRTGEPRDIYARAIVIGDGQQRLAMVVTDSCMLPQDLIDQVKAMVVAQSDLRADRIMISSTHTHTAPAAMGALGTEADASYLPHLRIKLTEAILKANANLTPAKVGWGATDAHQFTALRRWILRPDQMRLDPFGNQNVRASMHTARDNLENVTGESGPEDPELSMLVFRTLEDRPLALLANFSMHYYGGGGAADYFGDYCQQLETSLSDTGESTPPFVAIMSHGCSGDIWRVDYRDGTNQTYDGFVDGMVERTLQAVDGIEYLADLDIAMEETRLHLNYRLPSQERLAWAQPYMEAMEGRQPQDITEVYAREAVLLNELKSTDVVVQAIRIGPFGIATTPNETYALSGLKLKRQSPLEHTMVIELANGSLGYIPPPEQHLLGGYNTWPARSAGLETTAEPKIVEAALELLERVAGEPRRPLVPPASSMAQYIHSLSPTRYFPLDEMAGPLAHDASGGQHDAVFEPGVVFYLEGPDGEEFSEGAVLNRAPHFAGGRMVTSVPQEMASSPSQTISLWCWNGLAEDARPLSGWLYSSDRPFGLTEQGVHLGVIGAGEHAGKLVLQLGPNEKNRTFSSSKVERWSWAHVALVRTVDQWQVYLNGQLELSTDVHQASAASGRPEQPNLSGNRGTQLFLGGRSDNRDNWEGRLDEIAVFSRSLSPEEITHLANRAAPEAGDSTSDSLSEIEKTQGGRHWVDDEESQPQTPQQTLESFRVEPGYHVELAAAEPLVMDPVAVAFDRQGRLFVSEYGDYPIGPTEAGAAPLSRIVWLEDSDADGVLDKRHVFADELNFCHSLMPFRDGLLACAQTQILMLRDTDADGRADQREVLFDGFSPAHPQMQIGNPRWGLDNKIYFNYGPGEVTSTGSEQAVKLPRTEFQFDPRTMEFGPASGLGQYGNTVTEWGERLFSTNRNPIIAAPLSYAELQRNRYYPIAKSQYDVAPSGGESKVFPLVAMKSNWLSHAGTHTSACGTTAYVGDALGAAMQGSVFACEPIGHLVTRAVVRRDGIALASHRGEENADFLASSDTWFRPSSFANAPDGTLYLADMYRLWVEHPKFLPPEIAAKLNWRAGEDRGRIWRIVADNPSTAAAYSPPNTVAEMVQLLSSSNGWQRRMGQQLLVEEQAIGAAPALNSLATTSDSPLTRLHALWTLQGLDSLSVETLNHSLKDSHPEVRAAAVVLASQTWQDTPELLTEVLALAADASPLVRFRVALALGKTEDPRKPAVLAKIAERADAGDLSVDAVLTSVESCSGEVLSHLADDSAAPRPLQRSLASIVGARNHPAEVEHVVRLATRPENRGRQALLLLGLSEGQRRADSKTRKTLEQLLLAAQQNVAVFVQATIDFASDTHQTLAARQEAIALLAELPVSDSMAQERWMHADQPQEIKMALINAWGSRLNLARAERLLESWSILSPQEKQTLLAHLWRRSDTALAALEAIAAGTIAPNLVSLDQQKALQEHKDKRVQSLAVATLGSASNPDRDEVLAKYQTAVQMIGSSRVGSEVFAKNCAKCHLPNEANGQRVGPDLADSRNRPRTALLYDILHPSGKVEPKYTAYRILTTDGQALTGLITTETSDSVILQLADGVLKTIARSDIELLQASPLSLMPEGVEKEISLTQMADLLQFLQTTGPQSSPQPAP